MGICVETLEGFFGGVAFFTEEKIVAVLTHKTAFLDYFLTAETLIFFIIIELWFKHCLEFMVTSVCLRTVASLMDASFKKTFLTYQLMYGYIA